MSRVAASHARRQEILRAALECFVTRGFEATTIDDIRARSGASVGSIYHHFGSKEELAAALYLEGLRDYQAGFVRELRRHRSAEAGIRGVVAYYLTWVERHADWARYLFAMGDLGAALSGRALQELNQAFFRDVAAWMQPHIERGAIVRLPPDLYRPVLFGPLHEFSRQWLAGRSSSTMAEARRVLPAAVWRSLQGPGAGRQRPAGGGDGQGEEAGS
ncbi:MAG TPA: TetR/AcrR family transcriptional regulator [Dehalococcoidia bacterium]